MLAAVINHLWQSTLFAGGVAIMTLILRHNSARVRYILWFSASVKFLLPFALLAALGSLIPREPPNVEVNTGGAQVLGVVIDRIVTPMPVTAQVIGSAPLVAASAHPWLT